MKAIVLLCLAILAGILNDDCSAQTSMNMTLFGQINPQPGRSSGSWGYTDPNGREYALLGEFEGTSIVTIDHPDSIAEVAFIAGPGSNWREITVVGDYAYVTTEGSAPGVGMQIIDLSNLPETATLAGTYNATFGTAHIIARDIYSEAPFVYVMGSGGANQGIHILDISKPTDPQQVGLFNPYYIHDVHVRGNRMYASAIFNGTLDIVDITNKSTPNVITQFFHPQSFTHSSWTFDGHKYLVVTDEVDGYPARIWDIRNPENIEQISQFTSDTGTLVHNPYVRDHWVFVSHNSAGIRVYDIADPTLPVEVGFYDTHSGASGGSNGLWSAYPYFPSGKIIGGDRFGGLFIWEFNNTSAGRVYGTVSDGSSGQLLAGATVKILETDNTVFTDATGSFKIGELPSGENGYTFYAASADGQHEITIPNVMLDDGASFEFDIVLNQPVTIDPRNPLLPSEPVLYPNYPNPFNPSTQIAFFLPENDNIRLTIYNALGQQIRTLVSGSREAGYQQITWNGRDDQGNSVESGIYFYRLSSGNFDQQRKMILVR